MWFGVVILSSRPDGVRSLFEGDALTFRWHLAEEAECGHGGYVEAHQGRCRQILFPGWSRGKKIFLPGTGRRWICCGSHVWLFFETTSR